MQNTNEFPKLISPNGLHNPYIYIHSSEWEKTGDFTIINDRAYKPEDIPKDSQIWEGHGYTGGHVSNSKFDDQQEYRFMYSKIKEGFLVRNLTTHGNVSGYYPKVAYWKL